MYRAKRLAGVGDTTPVSWNVPSGDGAASMAPPVTEASTKPAADDGADHARRLAEIEHDAFGKGYTQGEKSGFEAGQTRAEAMLRRMAVTLDELNGLRQSMIRQTQQQLVHLALTIAKRILRREVTLDQEMTLAMARVALDRLGEHAGATIRLHPEDHAMVIGGGGDRWAGANVVVEADDRISRGGCRIESAFGFIDGSVDAQFDEVANAVLADEPAPAIVSAA